MNGIKHLADTWPRHVRYTDNVARTLWRELSRYGGTDAADRAFQLWRADDRYCTDFRAAIRLADAYFLAFEDAEESIDADMLYYGSMWLGYAVSYLSLGPAELREASTGHGIVVSVDSGKNNPFLNTRLNIGAESQMLGRVNKALGGDSLEGMAFSAADFLCAIPELDEHLREIDGHGTAAVRLSPAPGVAFTESEPISRNNFIVSVPGKKNITHGWMRDNVVAYPYLKSRGLDIDRFGHLGWHRTRTVAEELSAVCVECPGPVYFLAPTISKRRVPELTVFLAILFALSRIVRYNPRFWLTIEENQTDEYFLIRQFVDLAVRKVPNLVINHLGKRTFVLSS